MIRACLLTPNLTLGGAERWCLSLVKYAVPDTLKWTGVVVSGWGGADRSLCSEIAHLVPLHCNLVSQSQRSHQRGFDYSHFAGIHATLPEAVAEAAKGADVIVAWGGPDLTSWLPALRIPVVLTSHTTEVTVDPIPVRGATHLVAVSEAAAKFFDGKNTNELPVSVIYNGAELERCTSECTRISKRGELGVDPDDIVVGYIGRQSREKNPRAAIDAVSSLPPHFKAIYYGEPVSRPGDADLNLHGYANERAHGRVLFRPPTQQVGDALVGIDVVMLASHREAFSLTLIEAWLTGKPVIATPVGALPELERKFGKLAIDVPINPTAEELSEAVCRAVGNEGKSIAALAQSIAMEHFTCEMMIRRWTDYLRGVVSRP